MAGSDGGSGRADESDKECWALQDFLLYGGCLFGASVATNGPLPTVEEIPYDR